jgi:hypothetical protein
VPTAVGQQLERDPIVDLQAKVSRLESQSDEARNTGGVLFLFGAFCALWAQNTGRNPWLWFFLGFAFSVITVFFLLTKNADDNFERRQFGRTTIDLNREKERPG